MTTERSNLAGLPDPHAQMEQEFLAEYVHCHLSMPQSLHSLSAPARRQLMVEASRYASARLAELETRARLVNAVHGAFHPRPFA